jgi:hypothetical protein
VTARNARKFAEQASATPTGVVLAVKVYAYPDGRFEFTATDAREHARTPVRAVSDFAIIIEELHGRGRREHEPAT